MVIDVIAGQIGEQRSIEIQSGDAFLRDGMRGDLHEGVGTTGVHHLSEQAVQFQGVRRGMCSCNCLIFNVIDYGGEQAGFITQRAYEFV